MSLLRDIQNAAVDSTTDLATVLRKCKILGARLGSREFKEWVDHELNGYPDLESIPTYRILRVHSKGHFSGPFGSGLRNAGIPLMNIPGEMRELLQYSHLTSSVATLESLTRQGGGFAQENWPPDIVAMFADSFYYNMNCLQAWKVIPIGGIVGILNSVRNKILSFVLEIEAEAPDAGEAPVNSSPVPQARVQQIFNTYITGTVHNLASGGSNIERTVKVSGGQIGAVNQGNHVQVNVTQNVQQNAIADLAAQLRSKIEHAPELDSPMKKEAIEQVDSIRHEAQQPKPLSSRIKAAASYIKTLIEGGRVAAVTATEIQGLLAEISKAAGGLSGS